MYYRFRYENIIKQEETVNSDQGAIKRNQDFRMAMLRLVFWSRMYLLSISENMGDKNEVAARLRKIPQEMADVFTEYYPVATVEPLKQAFTDFVDNIMQLMDVVKDGDVEKTSQAEARLKQDMVQISLILNNMSESYKTDDVQRVLTEFIMMTKREIASRLTGDYEADINTADELVGIALRIADYLSEGIKNK